VVVVLGDVFVMFTFPVRVVFPALSVLVLTFPAVTCPSTPNPPAIVVAPVDVDVLCVGLVFVVIPDEVRLRVVVFPAERVPVVIDPELI